MRFRLAFSLIAAAAAILCNVEPAVAQYAPPAKDVRWYVGHLGEETCVPLDDVGPDLNRLYYGAGNMHTPEDFVAVALSRGIRMHTVTMKHDGMRGYTSIDVNGRPMGFVLFNDKYLCQAAMKTFKEDR